MSARLKCDQAFGFSEGRARIFFWQHAGARPTGERRRGWADPKAPKRCALGETSPMPPMNPSACPEKKKKGGNPRSGRAQVIQLIVLGVVSASCIMDLALRKPPRSPIRERQEATRNIKAAPAPIARP